MRIGFLGAGRMGLPMVARLVGRGHDVRVLVRSPERHTDAADTGAVVTTRDTEVAEGAQAVVVCVYSDEQVRQLCLDTDILAATPPGAVLVVHTTGSPRTVAAVAERAAGYGIDVVDAPVSGGPHDIAEGRLTLFVGGSAEAVARARPVLSCYGDPIVHVGELGLGQRVKLLNNAAFAAQIGVLTEIVRLAGELGVDEPTLLGALPHGSATSRALLGAAARGSVAEFRAAVADFLAKDVAVVRAISTDFGARLGSLDDLFAGAASRTEQESR
ncbi:NAD(P)-dependent oxidoreductase [Nocardia farcinica]|uniref:NAD(P)-dependent oxidoreductase n=1 Tax=Nocardia farcinica TaxID=37329 RepID=UPI00379F6BD9